MSDTPRTDAAETRANASTNPYSVLREHARDLERKLAEAMDRSQEDWVALTQRAERAEAENARLKMHAEAMEAAIFDLSAYDSNDAVIAYRADFPKEHDK